MSPAALKAPAHVAHGPKPIVRFRAGPQLFIWFTTYARPETRGGLTLFGPSPREAMQDLLRRLLLEPRNVRAVAGPANTVELRSADDPIGDGVVFCVIGGQIGAPEANDALHRLDRDGWGPTIP